MGHMAAGDAQHLASVLKKAILSRAATTNHTTEKGLQSPSHDVIFSQLIIKVLLENCKLLYSEQSKVPLGCACIYTYIYIPRLSIVSEYLL